MNKSKCNDGDKIEKEIFKRTLIKKKKFNKEEQIIRKKQ